MNAPMIKNPVGAAIGSTEWKRRATDWFMKAYLGGEDGKEQEIIRNIGQSLQASRFDQKICIEETARHLKITPQTLCFYESGWGSKEEVESVLDRWLLFLGVDPHEIKSQLKGVHKNDG